MNDQHQDEYQDYVVFIQAENYNKYFSGTTSNDSWKSNGMSEENIENITRSHINFATSFVDYHLLPDISFNDHCLINNIYISKKVMNTYIFAH